MSDRDTLQNVLDQINAAREGNIAALIAITKALRASPNFNVEELERWSQYFQDNPTGAADKDKDTMDAYRLPLKALAHRDVSVE